MENVPCVVAGAVTFGWRRSVVVAEKGRLACEVREAQADESGKAFKSRLFEGMRPCSWVRARRVKEVPWLETCDGPESRCWILGLQWVRLRAFDGERRRLRGRKG